MRIVITQIVLRLDNKDVEVLYGLDSNGIVYQYRGWTDEEKTEGWVPCIMELSENTKLIEQSDDDKPKTAD